MDEADAAADAEDVIEIETGIEDQSGAVPLRCEAAVPCRPSDREAADEKALILLTMSTT